MSVIPLIMTPPWWTPAVPRAVMFLYKLTKKF
jgi:hypothetical protein